MKRTNQMQMYRLGNLTRLRELEEKSTLADRMSTITVAEIYLKSFLEDPLNPELVPRALERAQELMTELKRHSYAEKEKGIGGIQFIELLLSRFEASLEDDLVRLPTYLIERTAAYSTDQLISSAENIFPEGLRKTLIPAQAILDFKSAGACLAFDLPTACGFHVYRATDAMLRRYCDHFGAKPKGSARDWGKYIGALRNVFDAPNTPRKPNERTIELLDSIRAVDRNPLVHPEQNLDRDGAVVAFDLCKNAVSLMALDIKNAS